jgi:5-methyltetrahydrofolate--homocysteine methyltransferase
MSRLVETLRSGHVLLMDGAMGTELQQAGIQEGECYELWNLTHSDTVAAIHRSYQMAGAECLLTNTFQANPQALDRHGLSHQLESICAAAVALARSAIGPTGFVLGDIGPIGERGRVSAPRTVRDRASAPSDDDTRASLHRVAASLRDCDALLLETWSDPTTLPSILQNFSAPILCALTFQRTPDGKLRTIDGSTPEEAARLADKLGLTALGVNCGREIGMDEIICIIRAYRQETDLPLFARPNAGTPIRAATPSGAASAPRVQWEYPRTPELMADRLAELLEASVAMVGGCCGTTPRHIATFRPNIDAWNRRPKNSGNV